MKYTEEDLTLAQFIAKYRVLHSFLPETDDRTKNEYVADMIIEKIIHPMQAESAVRLDRMYDLLKGQYFDGYRDGMDEALD